MTRFIVFALRFLACAGCFTPYAVAYARPLGPIADFMTMDVCVDEKGKAIDAIPGDGNCAHHRDIQPGEAPHYRLQNFSSPDANCAAGTISKINIPVTRNGKTRIVSSTTYQSACGRNKVQASGDPEAEGGASIQWFDAGYGFIMGSYSPVALSTFESDRCFVTPSDSQRFFRGWVIGPSEVPDSGSTGFGIFPSKLRTGAAAENFGKCAARYNRALTTWRVGVVTYRSGRILTSLTSSHYAQGALDGQSPGDAMQMEQTYWTREFGLSRWEKWARSDWVHPRSGKTAPELAANLARAGRCNPPPSTSVNVSPRLQIHPVHGGTADVPYAMVLRDPTTGKEQTWYMTLCEDYTNAVLQPPGKSTDLQSVMSLANGDYWR